MPAASPPSSRSLTTSVYVLRTEEVEEYAKQGTKANLDAFLYRLSSMVPPQTPASPFPASLSPSPTSFCRLS
jgi:hypothetical protein